MFDALVVGVLHVVGFCSPDNGCGVIVGRGLGFGLCLCLFWIHDGLGGFMGMKSEAQLGWFTGSNVGRKQQLETEGVLYVKLRST